MSAEKTIENVASKNFPTTMSKAFEKFNKVLDAVGNRARESNIALNDTELCDTNLFAFLNDWLKSLQGDKKQELVNVLKENDALSKEVLFKELHKHLEDNKSLSAESLKAKNIHSLVSVESQLSKEGIKEMTFNAIRETILSNPATKVIGQIAPKVVSAVLNAESEKETNTLNETAKKIHKLVK